MELHPTTHFAKMNLNLTVQLKAGKKDESPALTGQLDPCATRHAQIDLKS